MERTKNMKKKERRKATVISKQNGEKMIGGRGEGKINKRENGWPSVHLSFHSVLSWIFSQQKLPAWPSGALGLLQGQPKLCWRTQILQSHI